MTLRTLSYTGGAYPQAMTEPVRTGPRLASLDPRRWSDQNQFAAFVGFAVLIGVATLLLTIVAPTLATLSWFGVVPWVALSWRIDGYRYRDIATWAIPLLALILVAQLVRGTLVLGLGLLLILSVGALMFSSTVRERWLSRVAPNWVANRDRVWNELLDLDIGIKAAAEQYDRDADQAGLHQRAEDLLERAGALSIDDRAISEARGLLVAYLESLSSLSAGSFDHPDRAFDALQAQLKLFHAALERLMDGR